jgi:hypothetical protein
MPYLQLVYTSLLSLSLDWNNAKRLANWRKEIENGSIAVDKMSAECLYLCQIWK